MIIEKNGRLPQLNKISNIIEKNVINIICITFMSRQDRENFWEFRI